MGDNDPARSLSIAEYILQLKPGDIGARKIRAYNLKKLDDTDGARAEYESLYQDLERLQKEGGEVAGKLAEELRFIKSKIDSL